MAGRVTITRFFGRRLSAIPDEDPGEGCELFIDLDGGRRAWLCIAASWSAAEELEQVPLTMTVAAADWHALLERARARLSIEAEEPAWHLVATAG